MTLPCHPENVEEAGRHFDRTVWQIQAAEFRVATPPEGQICRQCDLCRLCRADRHPVRTSAYNAECSPNRRPARSTALDLNRRRSSGVAKIDITRTELVWPGKYDDDGTLRETPRVQLPFQVIETVNESRAKREAQGAGSQPGLWSTSSGTTRRRRWTSRSGRR